MTTNKQHFVATINGERYEVWGTRINDVLIEFSSVPPVTDSVRAELKRIADVRWKTWGKILLLASERGP